MRLLIGNSTNADLVDESEKRGAAWWALRLLWFAEDDDVIVMSEPPAGVYLDYVTSMTGTDPSSLRIVVPPPGVDGMQWLSADRLQSPVLADMLGEAFAGRKVDEVLALWPDASVVALARSLGCEEAVPGAGFASQGGGALVNSKAIFRAVAMGTGLPLPAGAVCGNPRAAEDAVMELLERRRPAIVKHEFLSGGMGNEILSRDEGVRPFGARRVTVVPDRVACAGFFAENWDRLTGEGRYRLVVEEYYPESTAVFAEFLITDDGPEFGGNGQMFYIPIANAQAIPAPPPLSESMPQVVDHSRRLCETLHAMGYRGRLSADAIVTPDGEIYFTEYNGRVTGSTHLYAVLGKRIVGADYAEDRLLFERVGWRVPSFEEAAAAVRDAGLTYDPATRTGVIFCSAFDRPSSTLWYCLVERDIESARKTEVTLNGLFPQQP
ncbi:preATP grasp domain-containing protein [Sinosporangium siamense]|uniref:ATP-grasp domain-containing protein n=1 Tax=Sinosporangium siamense TaxID=1367973 RepID=A0A919RFA7_9ACTN|nr:peptide ligase PGM1-related protein [Sinosporangium siamense]GII92841.1 hypothetical protein Ssi02_30720 [Sinosporangium siamense]